MLICTVLGKCVSTIKHKKLVGYSFVTVQKLKEDGKSSGEFMVAIDPIGCSQGETVLVTIGETAKHAVDAEALPADVVIVGIVDTFDRLEKTNRKKERSSS